MHEEWSFLGKKKVNALSNNGNDEGMTTFSIQEAENWVIYSRIKVIWKNTIIYVTTLYFEKKKINKWGEKYVLCNCLLLRIVLLSSHDFAKCAMVFQYPASSKMRWLVAHNGQKGGNYRKK